ncbi:hypothetical protein HOY80DRAFT_472383 [Tuber brumale]|nr:hypothetical protein HOY80DRAFT_472383 [Tuber brumale]
MSNPPSSSSFQSDKPLLHHLTIDLILAILNHTFLNPIFAWLIPLAYRAQTFQYHHPPFYLSAAYAAFVTVLWIAKQVNRRLAYGNRREFDWVEEVVVITGGASGLGLLIAEVYGMKGVTVAVLDVREPEGGEARNVEFYKCDVGDRKQVEAVAKDIERDLGTPTVLINNAAIVNGKRVLELSAEEIETNFKTNLLSSFYTIKQFLPGMLRLNRGSIITISSVLSSIAPAQLSDYAASKAALKSLHSSLTAELADQPGIKTLLVTPGQLSTPLFYGVKTPSNFFAPVLEPVDVAKEIIAAIDGGLGGHISMPVYSRWIGVMEVLPASVQKFLRWASGADRAMAGFKGRKVLDQEGNKTW